ncbi:MAG TPA: DUF4270 domain-containing protein [Lentimicrobium sp.]|nr:DUF4270 domain-containing protein [Lentimicrobium sp.]
MHKSSLSRLFAALMIAALITACKKEPDLIGLDLLPEGDYLGMSFTDTTTIIAYTLAEDSLPSDELSTSILGYMNDPVFGRTMASFYTEYRLPANNVSFGANAVADSVVLTLVYSGVYGDSLSQHTIKVYELSDTLGFDKTYYSNSEVAYNPIPIGQVTFVPNLKAADSVDGKYMPPHLRITLSQQYASKLMNASDSTLSSNAYFREVFKGLYIAPEPVTTTPSGALLYFDLLHDNSRINVYYRNSNDTTSIALPINSACARFNNYTHFGHEGASPLMLQQFAGDTAAGDQQVFLQSMAGTKVKLRFPYLKNIPEKANIAVNEAILVLTNDDAESALKPPSQLALRALSDTGTYKMMYDESIGTAYFGGRYVNNGEYRFRVSKYVQDMMRNPETRDNGLMLLISGSSLKGDRVVLSGPGGTASRMKLIIYYTLIE